MSEKVLPRQIDPVQLTDRKFKLEGSFHLSEMERLSELLYDNKGLADFQLSFGKDKEGIRLIEGSIRADVKVICQRCMKPLSLKLNLPVKLSPVFSNEEARQLPKDYDPLVMDTELVTLIDIIEDEILVNIPSFPKHDIEKCSIKIDDLLERKTKKQQNKDNPFNVLENLIKKR